MIFTTIVPSPNQVIRDTRIRIFIPRVTPRLHFVQSFRKTQDMLIGFQRGLMIGLVNILNSVLT